MKIFISSLLILASCVASGPKYYSPNGVRIQKFKNLNELVDFSNKRVQKYEEVDVLHIVSLINRISAHISNNNMRTWKEADFWINNYLDQSLINGIHENEPVIPSQTEVFIVREYFVNLISIYENQNVPPENLKRVIQGASRNLIFNIIDNSYQKEGRIYALANIYI